MNKRILLSLLATLSFFAMIGANIISAYSGFSSTGGFDSETFIQKQQIAVQNQEAKNHLAEDKVIRGMNEVESFNDEQAEEDEASERRKYEKEIIKGSAPK